jgi:hypothetical protein
MDTVKDIYEAFGRGHVLAILDKLDDDVEWETVTPVEGVPWLQTRRGKANIGTFFESLAPLQITRFEPHTFFESGDRVFVLIAFEATRDGKTYSVPHNGHLWQANASGKVAKYDHVTDPVTLWRLANGR